MRFYGREEELQTLRSQTQLAIKHRTARMAVVTGRRRVGKTTLIEEAFGAADIRAAVPYAYCFVSQLIDEQDFCHALIGSVAKTLNITYPPMLDRADDAFGYLLDLARSTPYILAIDECQEAENRVQNFWAKLQKAWDRGKAGSQLVLVLTGSIQTTLERAFGEHNAPLFGRADLFFILQPFSTYEMQHIFKVECPTGTLSDLLLLHAATGGVARYVDFFASQDAMQKDALLSSIFSANGSWFQAEGQIVTANEFLRKSPVYTRILLLIAAGTTKRNELQDRIETDISPYIQRLETDYRLIERIEPILHKKTSKGLRFAIRDPYLRFWYAFVERELPKSYLERGHYAQARAYAEAGLPVFLGRTLEDWFLERYKENPAWIHVGQWWDRKGENEIDVVAIDTTARRAEFVEVNLNREKYDEFALRQKVSAFLAVHPEYRSFELSVRGLSIDNMLDDL